MFLGPAGGAGELHIDLCVLEEHDNHSWVWSRRASCWGPSRWEVGSSQEKSTPSSWEEHCSPTQQPPSPGVLNRVLIARLLKMFCSGIKLIYNYTVLRSLRHFIPFLSFSSVWVDRMSMFGIKSRARGMSRVISFRNWFKSLALGGGGGQEDDTTGLNLWEQLLNVLEFPLLTLSRWHDPPPPSPELLDHSSQDQVTNIPSQSCCCCWHVSWMLVPLTVNHEPDPVDLSPWAEESHGVFHVVLLHQITDRQVTWKEKVC